MVGKKPNGENEVKEQMRLRVSTRKAPYDFIDVDEFEIIADSGFEMTARMEKGKHVITYKDGSAKDWRNDERV